MGRTVHGGELSLVNGPWGQTVCAANGPWGANCPWRTVLGGERSMARGERSAWAWRTVRWDTANSPDPWSSTHLIGMQAGKIKGTYLRWLNESLKLPPESLKEDGYETHAVGK